MEKKEVLDALKKHRQLEERSKCIAKIYANIHDIELNDYFSFVFGTMVHVESISEYGTEPVDFWFPISYLWENAWIAKEELRKEELRKLEENQKAEKDKVAEYKLYLKLKEKYEET